MTKRLQELHMQLDELNNLIQQIFESSDFTKYVETIAPLGAVNPYSLNKHRKEFCSNVKNNIVQQEQLRFNQVVIHLNKLIEERDKLDQFLRSQTVQPPI